MGMCVVYRFCKYGPRPMHPDHELDGDADDDSPRSGTSSDGSRMLGRRGSRGAELRHDQHPALWKRTIPKGRRCEPLAFSGLILYDEHGDRLPQFSPTSYPSDTDA